MWHSMTFQGLAITAILLPGASVAHPDMTAFDAGTFLQPNEIVDCTLEDGTQAQCHKITVGYRPANLEIGPFCPATLDDPGGIWNWDGENPGLYRVNRDFLVMLDDLGYRFYDDDGTVHIADIAVAEPAHDHACINVSEDEDVEITMLIPLEPKRADTPTLLRTVSKVGVALDGVPIFSDAPSVAVTGHMPALDLCGGHVDPGGWYHWHATSSDIATVYDQEDVEAECGLVQEPSALFGYAFDGYAIYGSAEPDGSQPTDLDACNGHVGPVVGGGVEYHYHASQDFPNLPPCLVGVQAEGNFVTTASAGVGALNAGPGGRGEPPRPGGGAAGEMPPGFEEAAAALGVSAEDLLRAINDAGGPRADLAQVARALGVDEERLRSALPPPPAR